MQLVGYEPKDIHCLFDMSLTELKQLKIILDCADIKFDSEIQEQKSAVAFLNNELYANICKYIKDIEDGTQSRS